VSRAAWARRARGAGAVLFWAFAQNLFILPWPPARGVDIARDPPAAWYRPIVPPVWGAALNVLVGALFLWWFVLRPGGRADARRRETFRLRPVPRAARPWAVAAAAGAAVAVNAALVVLPRFAGLPSREPVLEHYAGLPGGALAIAAVAVCTAPFLEEFFFRGWAQGRLERRASPWVAILVTAAVFAALHGLDAFGLALRATLAVGLGYAAWATGSIWPSVGMHAAYNLSLFAGGAALPALLPRPPRAEAWADTERAALFFWAHEPGVFWPALAVLALAAAVVVVALRRMAAAAGAGAGAHLET